MCSCCPFSTTSLATYHSNIGDQSQTSKSDHKSPFNYSLSPMTQGVISCRDSIPYHHLTSSFGPTTWHGDSYMFSRIEVLVLLHFALIWGRTMPWSEFRFIFDSHRMSLRLEQRRQTFLHVGVAHCKIQLFKLYFGQYHEANMFQRWLSSSI
jgi:hypothetical protein